MASASNAEPRAPRAALAPLSFVHAAVLGAAAYALPWPLLTVFAVLAGLTAVAHLVTSVLAIVGARARVTAWRTSGLLSLGLLAYVTYAAIGSGLYVNLLYDGVGTAILAASVGAWCAFALFLMPYAVWAIVATGGLFRWRARGTNGGGAAIVLGVVVLAYAAASRASEARGTRHLQGTEAELDEAVSIALSGLAPAPPAKPPGPSLFSPKPTTCASRIHASRDATAFVTYLEADDEGEGAHPAIACVQGATVDDVLAKVRATLAAEQAFGDAVVDVVISTRELPDAGPLLGSIIVVPGTEGVCDEERCLLPWQLFGLDAFTEATSIATLQAELGVTAEALRKHLGSAGAGFVGLDALTTRTYLLRARDGSVTPLKHLRAGPRPLDAPTLEAAVRDAAGFVAGAQVKDGRFRYMIQPFTGSSNFDGFNIPRQAGTTLALCDAARYSPKARDVAKASLTFLTTLVQENGDKGGIVFPKGKTDLDASLGNVALPLIAFFRCRDLVGTGFDETILKLSRALLSMQRDNGSFAPAWSPRTGARVDGKDGLYAAGQGLFALVLWEGNEGEGLERPADLKARIDKAMAYYAGPYWDIPLRDFFYLEENWHCMAAKAALDHHRNEAYERFCTDYMTMKMRFIQSPSSGVPEDHVGSYAFGHVFPPHHAAAAGFAEGLAASIEIKKARGESAEEEEKVMRWTLSYLLRFQWREDNCFMCTRKLRIVGGFSENAASPNIRIDFAQHSMSGMLHAARALGILPR